MTTALHTRPLQSLGEILRYSLRGVTYPVSKTEMVRLAEHNGATVDLLETLGDVGESYYFGLTDVLEEIFYIDSEEESEEED